ncbi:hypothetical protein Cde04nite_32530 [Cellulomonas denverensis]|uniref:Uncharacterized protein n=1 Tax=Cellulomonas denverensis TaxID=264297 RepID=A0A7X6KST2_9CELL|nr:hypothetical protein [Cellulomonas denverensis]NKY21498.1 hypothetical protein [Cellulomonas denverensis]GIG27009.1 hypothetical protein Cde04nite_32530 [Cellulomonas denverensis]
MESTLRRVGVPEHEVEETQDVDRGDAWDPALRVVEGEVRRRVAGGTRARVEVETQLASQQDVRAAVIQLDGILQRLLREEGGVHVVGARHVREPMTDNLSLHRDVIGDLDEAAIEQDSGVRPGPDPGQVLVNTWVIMGEQEAYVSHVRHETDALHPGPILKR